MGRTKKSIQEKLQKEMSEFVDEVVGLSVDQLNSRLAELAKAAEATQQAKENDRALEEAKNSAAELSAPYRDAKKAISLKSKYIISLIKDKGGK